MRKFVSHDMHFNIGPVWQITCLDQWFSMDAVISGSLSSFRHEKLFLNGYVIDLIFIKLVFAVSINKYISFHLMFVFFLVPNY